jgi:hypothetical protein
LLILRDAAIGEPLVELGRGSRLPACALAQLLERPHDVRLGLLGQHVDRRQPAAAFAAVLLDSCRSPPRPSARVRRPGDALDHRALLDMVAAGRRDPRDEDVAGFLQLDRAERLELAQLGDDPVAIAADAVEVEDAADQQLGQAAVDLPASSFRMASRASAAIASARFICRAPSRA